MYKNIMWEFAFLYKREHYNNHIKEIYNTEELDVDSTTRKIRVVRKEGNRNVNRILISIILI
mgnify:CR=1 FL=1